MSTVSPPATAPVTGAPTPPAQPPLAVPRAPRDAPDVWPPSAEAGWELVWADEFDGALCPDPANWGYESGFVRNQELQLYRHENAFCENGVLVLQARRETVDNPDHVPGSSDWRSSRKTAEYTSASIETKGRHAWQYGRIDVRTRFDVRAGVWPAIWTLGADGRWPARGEIDIMESFGGRMTAHLHWDGGKKRANILSIRSEDLLWPQEFHVWRMDWSPDRIDVLLDGRRVASFDIRDVRNPDGSNPFRQAHYLKLNLAISRIARDPSRTAFPVRMDVDYVRVYQRMVDAARP